MREGARPLLCELHAHTTWSDGELSLAAVVDHYGTAGFDVLCVTDHVLRGADPWPLRHGRPCVDATQRRRLPRRDRARARPRALGLRTPARALNGRQLFGSVAEAGLPAVACGDLHRAEQLPGWTTLVPCEQDEEALVDYLRSSRPVFLTRLEQPIVRARRVAGAGRYALVQRCASEPLPRRVQPSSLTPPDPLPHVRVIDRDGTASRRSAEGRESRGAGRGRLGGEAAS